jgi:uncharacterized protein DUF6804
MFTKIMKGFSIVALLLGLLLRSSANYRLALEFLVCVGAILVAWQAIRLGRYFWAAGFLAIAVVFNPAVPVALSRSTFFWIDLVCIATFVVSLAVLKRRPILSIPSITNRTPGSESL